MRLRPTIIGLVFLATLPGCAFLDDFFYGRSQRGAINQATANSPSERIQSQGAEARRELDAKHPDAPQFRF